MTRRCGYIAGPAGPHGGIRQVMRRVTRSGGAAIAAVLVLVVALGTMIRGTSGTSDGTGPSTDYTGLIEATGPTISDPQSRSDSEASTSQAQAEDAFANLDDVKSAATNYVEGHSYDPGHTDRSLAESLAPLVVGDEYWGSPGGQQDAYTTETLSEIAWAGKTDYRLTGWTLSRIDGYEAQGTANYEVRRANLRGQVIYEVPMVLRLGRDDETGEDTWKVAWAGEANMVADTGSISESNRR